MTGDFLSTCGTVEGLFVRRKVPRFIFEVNIATNNLKLEAMHLQWSIKTKIIW